MNPQNVLLLKAGLKFLFTSTLSDLAVIVFNNDLFLFVYFYSSTLVLCLGCISMFTVA